MKLNNIDMKEIKELIALRQEAKSEKNYELSDVLKSKLNQKDIVVQDSHFGTE